jgi:hypothetical protein
VQTADERILPNGTAYMTDAGMCGGKNSVLGVKKELIIGRFINHLPVKHEYDPKDIEIHGCVIEIDENNTSEYETRVERMFDNYDFDTVKKEKQSGDKFTYKMAREFAFKGALQKLATVAYGKFIEAVTGRQVTYPD